MTPREREALLRAQVQWAGRGRKPKPMGARIVFTTHCTDAVEEVTVPWSVPASKNAEWSWERRVPAWEHAKVEIKR